MISYLFWSRIQTDKQTHAHIITEINKGKLIPSKLKFLDFKTVIMDCTAHDVIPATLVFQNNDTAAMLMNQTNPVGVHMNVVPRSTGNTNRGTEN